MFGSCVSFKSVGSDDMCSECVCFDHVWVLGVTFLGVDVLSTFVWTLSEF